ncbi:MAG: DUF2752 domain-containing protein [Proteiniphilum sp.]|nr:DUF2752 domain-containing protein [Proteiniphilum sp.]MDD3909542.1 DUF2752 domain-containing protein [Proteiniphilum sp.]MDD4415435.1 DUF2752 domain-containing protein [Proteiniphilum sp.]
MKKNKGLAIGAAIGFLLMVALFVFYRFDPSVKPFFPKCPFLLATGYECPGCGSQRAIHSLLHLDIRTAFRQNAFMVLALPYIILGIYLEYFGGKEQYPKIEKFFFGRWAAVVLLVVIFAYWILRNLF